MLHDVDVFQMFVEGRRFICVTSYLFNANCDATSSLLQFYGLLFHVYDIVNSEESKLSNFQSE